MMEFGANATDLEARPIGATLQGMAAYTALAGIAWIAAAAGCGNSAEPAASAPPSRRAPEVSPAPAKAAAPAAPDAGPEPVAVTPAPDAAAPTARERPDDLVDITDVDDTIALDIRYATTNNFTKVAVYPVARCRLRRDVARRVAAVHKALRAVGYGLKLWDCYRPVSVQKKFWELVPDERYVARPVFRRGKPIAGSKHNRGAAVDLTLITADGADLELPTEYDDFSPRAHRGSRASKTARRHSDILERAMVAEGFEPLATEWWHFDGPNWRRYPLSDEPL